MLGVVVLCVRCARALVGLCFFRVVLSVLVCVLLCDCVGCLVYSFLVFVG